MSYSMKGKVKVLGATMVISEKFSKREFVVTDDTNMYPQDIMFQLTKDKCSLIDSLTIGDEVEVSFNLSGKEWVNPKDNLARYFNTLDAWKIVKVGSNAIKDSQGQGFEPKKSVIEEVVSNDDLLPF